ncbi:MAG: hypothetical protein IMF17_03485 [Proteobacteria bacterium]|nr:hypothetical protein [Pseudomonadota bacterium]
MKLKRSKLAVSNLQRQFESKKPVFLSAFFMYRMYGISQRARDGGANMVRKYSMTRCHGWQGAAHGQDVRTGNCSCITCTSTIRGGRISQRAMDCGASHTF